MTTESFTLLASALTIGVVHTITGPDHYLPFVVIAKAKKWSMLRTLYIVAICGVGHVIGSIALGLVGIALGSSLSHVELIEGVRGSLAAWLLFLAGILYGGWGIYRASQTSHAHTHISTKKTLTFWVLFTIFVFGPCEPLIPLLMYPAAAMNTGLLALVVLVFAVATIGTMLLSVYSALKGISFVRIHLLERYQHALAGLTISLCGAGMLFLGL